MGQSNSQANAAVGSSVLYIVGLGLAPFTGGASLALTAAGVAGIGTEIIGKTVDASPESMATARFATRGLTTIATAPIAGPVLALGGMATGAVALTTKVAEDVSHAPTTDVVFIGKTNMLVEKKKTIKKIYWFSNDLHHMGGFGTVATSVVGAITTGSGAPLHYFIVVQTTNKRFYTIQKDNKERSVVWSSSLDEAKQYGYLKGKSVGTITPGLVKHKDIFELGHNIQFLMNIIENEPSEYQLLIANCQQFAENIWRQMT